MSVAKSIYSNNIIHYLLNPILSIIMGILLGQLSDLWVVINNTTYVWIPIMCLPYLRMIIPILRIFAIELLLLLEIRHSYIKKSHCESKELSYPYGVPFSYTLSAPFRPGTFCK